MIASHSFTHIQKWASAISHAKEIQKVQCIYTFRWMKMVFKAVQVNRKNYIQTSAYYTHCQLLANS